MWIEYQRRLCVRRASLHVHDAGTVEVDGERHAYACRGGAGSFFDGDAIGVEVNSHRRRLNEIGSSR